MTNQNNYQLKPKKSLGQNFFINKNLAEKISSKVVASNPDLIIEIGPGRGVFTHLLSHNSDLTAIEIDETQCEILTKIPELEGIKFINADVLDLSESDLDDITKGYLNTIVFGSLPYNQSKRIIEKFLIWHQAKEMYFIVQKEVAQKYTQTLPSNRLSILSDIYSEKKIIEKIGPESFYPQPKVKSSLIKFTPTKEPQLSKSEFKSFKGFLNQAFNKPRKKLSNNLSKKMVSQIKQTEQLSEKLQLRPEQIPTDQFIELFRAVV